MNMVHASQEGAILKWLVKYDSNLLLMHHRFPTSTINVKRAAHPFSTKKYFGKTQYILVHNGGIVNDEELFVEHQEKGIRYHSLLEDLTFNDSEALLWDFALFMEGKQDSLKARGGIAFICLKLVKGKLEKMYFGRNSNPLNMLRTKEGISLSSEGAGEAIATNTLYTWNYKLKRLTTKQLTIPGYVYVTNYSKNWDNNWDNYSGGGAYTPGSYASSRWNTKTQRWDWEDEADDNYVRNVLARQFGDKFAKDKFGKKNVIEYEPDPDTQLYLPVSSKTARVSLLQRKGQLPTNQEIQTEYLSYLASARGHFEQAYWSMEADYEWYCDGPDTLANLKKRVLLEKVMERIQNDPQYINEESVSDVWSKTWENQTTAF